MALDVDYIVIGRGMCGSAAAAHLAREGAAVVLLGPGEPEDISTHDGVFASHYDEARISRIIDPDPNRAYLAKESIRRHRELEKESGVSFFHEVGHLAVGEARGVSRDYINDLKETAKHHRTEISVLFSQDLETRFPYLHFGSRGIGVIQEKDAGYINPRKFIEANCKVVAENDGMLIDDIAQKIELRDGLIRVPSSEKDSVFAKSAIVATGAFTDSASLLPEQLDLRIEAELTVLGTISEQTADQLANFPSLIFKPAEKEKHIYLTPPVKHLDGSWKIKLGTSLAPTLTPSLDSLKNWFNSGGSEERRNSVKDKLAQLLPDVEFLNFEFKPCVTTHTSNTMPIIKFFHDRKVLSLVGGNGFAAKCSDEIGRLAAEYLRIKIWNSPLPEHLFLPEA